MRLVTTSTAANGYNLVITVWSKKTIVKLHHCMSSIFAPPNCNKLFQPRNTTIKLTSGYNQFIYQHAEDKIRTNTQHSELYIIIVTQQKTQLERERNNAITTIR